MKNKQSLKQTGFTIVELIIIIIVIGIIAGILMASYNGAQNRAHDTSVKNDLKNIGDEFEIFHAYKTGTLGEYPDEPAELDGLSINISKSAYATYPSVTFNLLTCRIAYAATTYAVLATSKSGKRFYVTDGKVEEYTGATPWNTADYNGICGSIMPGSQNIMAGYNYGDANPNNRWRAWTEVSI